MLATYFKIALRSFSRQRVFSIINVIGLSVGITACLLIYLYVKFELSFDAFHPDKKYIYRIVCDVQLRSGEKFSMTGIPQPKMMCDAFRTELSGIESGTVFYYYDAKTTIPDGGSTPKRFERMAYGQSAPGRIVIAEPQYFSIFRYRWLAGNAVTALNEPFRVVLTESKARTYFGQMSVEQMIGREVIYNDSLHVTVSGIIADWNKNTDLNFTDLISSATIKSSFLKTDNGWQDNSQQFVKLSKEAIPGQIEKRMFPITDAHLHGSNGEKIRIRLESLTAIHFHDGYVRDPSFSRKAHLPALYGLMAIAAFILLIAAVNFINLSTARSVRRAREIGIRKVLGSLRAGLVLQFLSETFLLTVIATIISLAAAGPALRFLKSLLPDGISLRLTDPFIWIFLLLTIVITSLLAGFYPAWVLSSFKPVFSLKGQSGQPSGQRSYLRKGLILFQFTFSLVFIIGSIVVGDQLHYVLNKDMGFVKDAIITTWTGDQYPEAKKKLLAERISRLPGIEKVCFSWESPAVDYLRGGNLKCKEKGVEIFSEQRDGDENYIPLYGLKIIAGSNFQSPVNDTARETIINETCSRRLGFARPQDALGQLVETEFSGTKPFRVVGVVADFHAKSLHETIDPVFIIGSSSTSRQLSIKLSAAGKQLSHFTAAMAAIEKAWKEIYPGEKFQYQFFDETIARFYAREQQTARIMDLAMTISIFVSCMGLFGLVSFTAEQRTREIGIRKVLGASVSGIVLLLSKDFLKLVLIAIVIASPIAWYFIQGWLQHFAYRIAISWWVFAMAAILSLLIAMGTIGFRAIRAAMANPVKSLRSE